jgi:hypothetical protein
VRSGSVQVAWQASVLERHSRRSGWSKRQKGAAPTLTELFADLATDFRNKICQQETNWSDSLRGRSLTGTFHDRVREGRLYEA